jgi:hypothetical protein
LVEVKLIRNDSRSINYVTVSSIQSAKKKILLLINLCGSRGCNYSYIGQSHRAIQNRFVEHICAYKNIPDSSAVAYHMFFDANDQKRRYQHEFDFFNLKLVQLCSKSTKTRLPWNFSHPKVQKSEPVSTGRFTYSIFPDVTLRPWFEGQKEEESFVCTVSRVLSGHCSVRSHLGRFRIVEGLMCVCVQVIMRQWTTRFAGLS